MRTCGRACVRACLRAFVRALFPWRMDPPPKGYTSSCGVGSDPQLREGTPLRFRNCSEVTIQACGS
eukprot:13580950-Alexandrium_andersonii.AAC.1